MDASIRQASTADSPATGTGPGVAERTSLLAYKAGCLLLKATDDGLSPLKLSTRSYFVLAGIDRDTPPSQQDLARLLSIDPTTIVGIIDELGQLGYVTRTRNARDRRRYDLHLTPEGVSALARAHKAMDLAETGFVAPLTADQEHEFNLLLRRVVGDL
jgi:MarR family transcriptional regulator, lower aerobic nicotinate degradation pathway regulator